MDYMTYQFVPLEIIVIDSYCAVRVAVSPPSMVSVPLPSMMTLAVLPAFLMVNSKPSPAVAAASSVIVTTAPAVSSSARITLSVISDV